MKKMKKMMKMMQMSAACNTNVGSMIHRYETFWVGKAEKSAGVPCRALIFNHRQVEAARRLHGRREKPLSDLCVLT